MIKIIADSSSDTFEFKNHDFSFVPLKVKTATKEYVDNGTSEVLKMCEELSLTKDKTSTSCPNTYEWLESFSNDSDNLCITISANLSGSYNACMLAKQIYEESHNHKVIVVDSCSAGPELRLLIEKAKELIDKNLDVEEVEAVLEQYKYKTHTYFYTNSVNNLASNGRIPRLVSKAIAALKISLIGQGSKEGKIKVIHETRNSKKAIDYIVEKLPECGYENGKIRIDTCDNEKLESYLISKIKEIYPEADIDTKGCGILCSYYVEWHGIIISFEGKMKE